MSAVFNRDSFAAVLGSPFKLTTVDGLTVDLELTEVTRLKKGPYQQSFAAVFLLPEPYRAEQGLYTLVHETLGEMELLLVPIGVDGNRLKLEAVFNLLHEEGSSSSE